MLTKTLLQSDRAPDFRSTQILVPEWLKRDSLVFVVLDLGSFTLTLNFDLSFPAPVENLQGAITT